MLKTTIDLFFVLCYFYKSYLSEAPCLNRAQRFCFSGRKVLFPMKIWPYNIPHGFCGQPFPFYLLYFRSVTNSRNSFCSPWRQEPSNSHLLSRQVSLLNHRLYLIPTLCCALTLTSGSVIQKDCVCSLRCKYLPTPNPLQVPLDFFSSHSWEAALRTLLFHRFINEYNLFSSSSQTSKRFQITWQLQIWFRCHHRRITCAPHIPLKNVQALSVVQPVGSCCGVLGSPSPALIMLCKLPRHGETKLPPPWPNQRLSKLTRNLELA